MGAGGAPVMAFLAPVWGYLATAVMGLLGVAGLYLKGRADAAAKARTEAMARDLFNRSKADAVQAEVDRAPDGAAAERLRREWSR
jgi:hypothetical protein